MFTIQPALAALISSARKALVANFGLLIGIFALLTSTFALGASNGAVKKIVTDGNYIYVAGDFTTFAEQDRQLIARLNAEGGLDTSWTSPFTKINNSQVEALSVDSEEVYLGGYFDAVETSSQTLATRTARLNLNTGAFVDEFTGFPTIRNGSAITFNGSEIFIGSNQVLYRVDKNGFGVTSIFTDNAGITSSIVAETDTLYVAGPNLNLQSTGFAFGKITNIDTTPVINAGWNTSTWGTTGGVDSILVTENHIYLGGTFSDWGENNDIAHLVRLDRSTGAVDPNWLPNVSGGASPRVYTISALDGYLYIGGQFSSVGGQTRLNVARLNLDDAGTLDDTWSVPVGGAVYSIAQGPDGKIYAGGAFTSIDNDASKKYFGVLLDPLAFTINAPITGDLDLGSNAWEVIGDGSASVSGKITGDATSSLNFTLDHGATFTTENTIDTGKITLSRGRLDIGHGVTTANAEVNIIQAPPLFTSLSYLTIKNGGQLTTTTLDVVTRNKGRLVVEEGGQLTTTNTSIQPHNNVSSIGGVTLQGIWTNLNSLSITAGESDALLIENGGQLTTPNLTIDTDGGVRLVDADSLLRVDQGSNQGQGVVVINGAGRLRVGVPQGLPPEPPGTVEAAKVQLVSNGTLTFEHNSSNYDFGPTIGGAGIVNFDEGSTRLSGGMSNLESESTTIWMRDGATWSLGSDQNIETHAILNWEVGATLSVNVTDTQTFGKLTLSYSSNLGPAGEPNIKLADGNVNLAVNVADCAALNNGDVLEAVVKSIRGSVQTQPNTSVVVSDNCAELNFVAVIKEQQIDLNAIKPLSAIFEQGDGSTTDPYIITNWEQFAAIHQALDKHFVLAANLDKDSEGYATYGAATAHAGAGFDPIGALMLDGNNEVDETASSLFTGSLDGAGFTVSDLVINRSETSGVAVFAGLSATAKVTNLTLENISVTGKDFVAGLSAYTQGNITNVSVTGEVSGETVVGGLVAENLGNNTDQGVIDQANSNVVTTASAQTAGGLVAKNVTGEVKESSASGEVKATDTVGGLIGLNDGGAVDRSFSRTAVISDGTKVGGLVGEVSTASGTPTITESLWDQEASGQTSSAGGGSAQTSDDMTSFATYDALWNDETTTVIIEGWADPTDSSVTATWGICTGVNDGYPFRLLEYATDPCVISTLKITLSESGGLLRNIPFGVSITSESSFGDPIAVEEDVVITLSAEVSGSSTSGQLGFVDSDAPTTVTLSQGEHTVTVDNLFYSGLSDPEAVGDITLKAEAQLAEQTLSGQQAISVRDIAFVLTADETDPLPTGESFVITATLKDLNDQPVANQATTFTTTLGTLEGANSEGIVVATTDGTGKAQVTLTSDVAGDAVVTAKCPGSCPQSITVTFIALTAAAPVIESVEPGNGQLTVNFTPPTDLGGAVISNYEYQLNGGDWVAFDPAVITSPAMITGLTNGQDYTVKLRAISQGGPGEVSNGKTNSPFTAPTAPQNVTVTAQPAAILVSWASPADDGGRDITGYRVLINGEVACEVEAGAGTYSCRIEDLSSDAAYDVEVLAVTDGATTPSTEEATFEVTPLPILPVPTLSLWALIALMLLLLVWAQHSLRPRLS